MLTPPVTTPQGCPTQPGYARAALRSGCNFGAAALRSRLLGCTSAAHPPPCCTTQHFQGCPTQLSKLFDRAALRSQRYPTQRSGFGCCPAQHSGLLHTAKLITGLPYAAPKVSISVSRCPTQRSTSFAFHPVAACFAALPCATLAQLLLSLTSNLAVYKVKNVLIVR